MTRTLVIGGGAAGMAAAIAAAQRGESVTVLERNRKPLKKLGVTGNGRGNLLNSGPPVYYGGRDFAAQVLERMPYERLAAFFEELGVPLSAEEGGRVYPAALLAGVVCDALRLRATALGAEVLPCVRATDIAVDAGARAFCVHALESRYEPDSPRKSGKLKPGTLLEQRSLIFTAQRVIVAVGGAAAPMHGTDGSGYALLASLGHTLVPTRPALCALLTAPGPLAGLSGQRVRARLALADAQGRTLHESRGEALFADDGVSGIAAMQLARFAKEDCTLHMDLREALLGSFRAGEDAVAFVSRRAAARGELPLSELLTGAAAPPLARALLRMAGLAGLSRPCGELTAAECRALGDAIADFRLPVMGTRGFDAAQVTAGGICTDEFDPCTLQSRLVPGLHAAGEVLDVDGDCGGHNLAFAFASGLLAGKNEP